MRPEGLHHLRAIGGSREYAQPIHPINASRAGRDLWQLHESFNEGADNAPDAFIANVDDGATAYWIKMTVKADGNYSVLNSRTGFVKTYRPSHSPLTAHALRPAQAWTLDTPGLFRSFS